MREEHKAVLDFSTELLAYEFLTKCGCKFLKSASKRQSSSMKSAAAGVQNSKVGALICRANPNARAAW